MSTTPGTKEAVKTKKSRTKEFKSNFGNPFTFQRVLPSVWLGIMDDCNETGVVNRQKLYKAIFENVVVVPSGLNVDDFELEDQYNGYGEMEEVAKEALKFQQGK